MKRKDLPAGESVLAFYEKQAQKTGISIPDLIARDSGEAAMVIGRRMRWGEKKLKKKERKKICRAAAIMRDNAAALADYALKLEWKAGVGDAE